MADPIQQAAEHAEALMVGNPSEAYWEGVAWRRMTTEQKLDELWNQNQKERRLMKTLKRYLGIGIAAVVAYGSVEVVKAYKITAVPAAPVSQYYGGASTAVDRVPLPDAGQSRR
jgi:hypothetical protein